MRKIFSVYSAMSLGFIIAYLLADTPQDKDFFLQLVIYFGLLDAIDKKIDGLKETHSDEH